MRECQLYKHIRGTEFMVLESGFAKHYSLCVKLLIFAGRFLSFLKKIALNSEISGNIDKFYHQNTDKSYFELLGIIVFQCINI